jgi:hypothetical protein
MRKALFLMLKVASAPLSGTLAHPRINISNECEIDEKSNVQKSRIPASDKPAAF